MSKSLLFYSQVFPFFSGFFVCAAVGQLIRDGANSHWVLLSLFAGVNVFWSIKYASRLKRHILPSQ
jgi:hypothetical protein